VGGPSRTFMCLTDLVLSLQSQQFLTPGRSALAVQTRLESRLTCGIDEFPKLCPSSTLVGGEAEYDPEGLFSRPAVGNDRNDWQAEKSE
jgi:hypothetical protein